tara:strand:- start:4907 stop:6184 length:1278 start_codon:yes stop_codon:yes gene_type:complete
MSHQTGKTLGIIGLGYVGLPLAVAFGKRRGVVGFDINTQRVEQLNAGIDATLEVDQAGLAQATHLTFTDNLDELARCAIFILTVPTPVDEHKQPDFTAVSGACRTVGGILKRGDIVIFESTVYPGATEEICVPLLEKQSGLVFNRDFFVAYSPERINPGDRVHRLESIVKVVAGSTDSVTDEIAELYGEVVQAGIHRAPSIKVAEAAKVIENTQRDVNIALINELAMIFNRMDIDTGDVLDAAATKWNFLNFRPGLVGGHCIGVDPYYLTHKAQAIGYHPEMILAGRRINDQMSAYVATELVRLMIRRKIAMIGARILVLGLTFKENCPDIRNTKVVDLVAELAGYGVQVDVHDPWVDAQDAHRGYNLELVEHPVEGSYDGLIVAVAHQCFVDEGVASLKRYGKAEHIFYDLKSVFPAALVDARL